MPTRRRRLTKAEHDEYRTSLFQLREMGVIRGGAGELRQEPRYKLEQVDPEFARVYDLPAGDVAVVIPAKLTVLKPGVMITESEIFASWDDLALDLTDPEQHDCFDDLIKGLPYPPTILNDWLVERPVPMRPFQRKGVIIATGWNSLPAKYHEMTRVTMRLYLRDELGKELLFSLSACVDRSLKRAYERRRNYRSLAESSADRTPLFGSEQAKPRAQGHRNGEPRPDQSIKISRAIREIHRRTI